MNFTCPTDDIPDELSSLIGHFKKVLTFATDEKPIIIVFDSLDQLSGSDGAHQLAWLPAVLPPHVKFIVSTLPNMYSILDNLNCLLWFCVRLPSTYLIEDQFHKQR
jgi:hypothetical protein